MTETLLLTGTTGFLGQWILHQELAETDDRLILLVRAANDREAGDRVRGLLHYRFGEARDEHLERIETYAAHLDRPGLGLCAETASQIAAATTRIIHAGGNVSWTLPMKVARAVNVGGTAGVWDLAAQAASSGRLKRALYVSTVGVAGRNRGIFYESERDVRQRFHNTYERSKWEAEHVVEQMRPRVPATIVRPSGIVGETETGVTEAWNALYYVWRIYERYVRLGVRFFPLNADTVVDPVPVDWVARACRALVADPDADGLTVHLAQGYDRAPLGREVFGEGAAALGYPRPIFFPQRLFAPADMTVVRLASLAGPLAHRARAASAYFDLGQETGSFDCSVARRLLAPHELGAPGWQEFKQPVFRYMARTRLGRHAPATYPERRELALAPAAT